MVRLMKDLLAQSARETFVGRTTELQALSELLKQRISPDFSPRDRRSGKICSSGSIR
jgi:hypothetical protein